VKSYDVQTSNEKSLMMKQKVNYFIRCPYCRSSQTNLLPYYSEYGLSKIYGVNSNNQKDTYKQTNFSNSNNVIIKYDKIFTFGYQCYHIHKTKVGEHICNNSYVTNLTGTDKNYCFSHYNSYYKAHIKEINKKKKDEEKQKQIEEKQKQIEEKQKLIDEKKKLKEEKQKLIEEKKKLKEEKKNSAEEKQKLSEEKKESKGKVKQGSNICKAILKSGINKGKQCGLHTMGEFCGKHKSKD